MKLSVLLMCAVMLPAQTLHQIRSIYLFPMRGGFDQYLANAMTEQNLYQVVLDPQMADAFLTDRTGPAFERDFDEHILNVEPDKSEVRRGSIGSARGTLFLVGKSKQVLWSTYVPLKDTSAKQLDRTAQRAMERLKRTLSPKVTGSE